LKPWFSSFFVEQVARDDRAVMAGVLGDLAERRLIALRTMSMPRVWSSLTPFRPSRALVA
jgi:hypothetical protein